MKRLAIRWAAAVGLLLAATAPTARADLVLSIEPVGVTSMGYFHVMLTNTGPGTRFIEGVNVALTLGSDVNVGTTAATISAVSPPQFSQINSTPPFPLFTSPNAIFSSTLDYFPGPGGYPGAAQFVNNLLGGVDQNYALGAGQTVQVGFVQYNVNVIPNGAIVLPIQILPGSSVTTATQAGTVGDFTDPDPLGNNQLPPGGAPSQQIGSVFIPEPTSMVAFAGLVGLGAVIARRRRAA